MDPQQTKIDWDADDPVAPKKPSAAKYPAGAAPTAQAQPPKPASPPGQTKIDWGTGPSIATDKEPPVDIGQRSMKPSESVTKPFGSMRPEAHPVNAGANKLINDIRYGFAPQDTSWPARAARFVGFQGTERGAAPGLGSMMPGSAALEGASELGEAYTEPWHVNKQEHPMSTGTQMYNKVLGGTLKTAAGALPFAAPEALPAVVPGLATGGTVQTGAQKSAEFLGADPDTAEAIGNTAGVLVPTAGGTAGRFMERNAPALAKGTGYGATGVRLGQALVKAASGKGFHFNPLELLYPTDPVTRAIEPLIRGAGKAAQGLSIDNYLHPDYGPPAPDTLYGRNRLRNYMGMKPEAQPVIPKEPLQLEQGGIQLPSMTPGETPIVGTPYEGKPSTTPQDVTTKGYRVKDPETGKTSVQYRAGLHTGKKPFQPPEAGPQAPPNVTSTEPASSGNWITPPETQSPLIDTGSSGEPGKSVAPEQMTIKDYIGKIDEVIQSYQSVLEVDPNNAEAQKNISEWAKLRNEVSHPGYTNPFLDLGPSKTGTEPLTKGKTPLAKEYEQPEETKPEETPKEEAPKEAPKEEPNPLVETGEQPTEQKPPKDVDEKALQQELREGSENKKGAGQLFPWARNLFKEGPEEGPYNEELRGPNMPPEEPKPLIDTGEKKPSKMVKPTDMKPQPAGLTGGEDFSSEELEHLYGKDFKKTPEQERQDLLKRWAGGENKLLDYGSVEGGPKSLTIVDKEGNRHELNLPEDLHDKTIAYFRGGTPIPDEVVNELKNAHDEFAQGEEDKEEPPGEEPQPSQSHDLDLFENYKANLKSELGPQWDIKRGDFGEYQIFRGKDYVSGVHPSYIENDPNYKIDLMKMRFPNDVIKAAKPEVQQAARDMFVKTQKAAAMDDMMNSTAHHILSQGASPEMMSHFFSTLDRVYTAEKLPGRVAAYYHPKDRAIQFLSKWAKDKSNQGRSFFLHELGHHIQYEIGRGAVPLSDDLMNDGNAASEEFKTQQAKVLKHWGLKDEAALSKKEWFDRLDSGSPWVEHPADMENAIKLTAPSAYATANEREWFAENFRYYMENAENRMWMEDFLPGTYKFINNIVKGTYKGRPSTRWTVGNKLRERTNKLKGNQP
jgi:hypothetical protein